MIEALPETPFYFMTLTLMVGWASHIYGHPLGITLPYVWVVSQFTSWFDWLVVTLLLLSFSLLQGVVRAVQTW